MAYLDFEETDLGQLCRQINREAADLVRELPRRAYESADNFERAVKSMGRNAGEGWGKWQLADKIRYFLSTRGSGTEALASLDELVDFGYTTYERTVKLRTLIRKVIASVTGLIRYLEKQPSRRPRRSRPKSNEPKPMPDAESG